MKFRLVFVTLTILFLLTIKVFAQLDQKEPGIYAVVEKKIIPLKNTGGMYINTSILFSNHNIVQYDEITSGVDASDTFILVRDPERIVITSNNPFNRTVTPSHMLVLKLIVNADKGCREYDPGERHIGEILEITRPAFEWDQISDNSFMIKVIGLTPGEYALVFRDSKINPFDFRCVYDFTIKSPVK